MAPDRSLCRLARSLCLALCACLLTCPARADNWSASIYEDEAPSRLVGVDKSRRTFNLFEKKSPLRLRYSYPCVTGQIKGDKQQINDLRTPEGVYFVEYKIASGLDFREYGGVAYTLNYPNPVDRLRGKTGYGIWIHSKGFELVPTKGCVAIDLKNIHEVGPLLAPGTPVVVAEELKSISGEDSGDLEKLKGLMQEWSHSWAARSPRMFDFYDAAAYSNATENFNFFRQNKERLFKILSFIKIFNKEIHALEGPGYWVTWSEQLYAASNLSTEGVRRLYWQKDAKGDFKIVGMEWTPRDVGMQAAYKEGRLVAEAPSPVYSDATSEAPRPARLDMPEQPDVARTEFDPPEKARINETVAATVAAVQQSLAALSEPLVPAKPPRVEQPDEIRWGLGRALTREEDKDSQEATPAAPAPALQPAGTAQIPAPESGSPDVAQPVTAELDQARVHELAAQWVSAYRERDSAIEDFYDKASFNRLPGVARGRSYAATIQGIKRDAAQPWLEVIARPSSSQLADDMAQTEQEIIFVSPAGIRQGIQKMWWHKNDGDWKIVSADFVPRSLGLEANYLEAVSGQITQTLEAWRKAWEAGRLDEYMSYYTTDANQQGRAGRKTIHQQKERLWSRVKPALVQLSGMRLAVAPQGIRVDMNQTYADSSGHSDKGVKTLLMRFDGKNWRIQREDWTPAAPIQSAALPR